MEKNISMSQYSTFLEKFILPIGDFFNNSDYVKKLHYWRKLDTLSAIELENIQFKNLKKMLEHCVKNVPAYKSIQLKGDNPYQWISQFPLLTKDILRSDASRLLTQDTSKLIKYSSSGSTGMQTTVYMSKKEQSTIRAILSHWWEWSGYKLGNPIVQTGITPKRGRLKRIKDFLFQTIYISAFSHSEEQLKGVCDKLQKRDKKFYLAGYASSLNVIATYANQHNYHIQLKGAISLGDKLFDHYKKNITTTFLCNVYDTYGCNEGFLIASQKDLEYKYIMTPHVYLEILDDNNQPVPDGEMGHVFVTRLDAFSMPLIRYRNGDLAIKLPKEKYPPNRDFNYPLLEKIVGRETDVIHLPNGGKMVVHSFTGVFEYIPEIKQFQVIQEVLDSILINYIPSENFNQGALKKAELELQKYIDDKSFAIHFVEVDEIPTAKSGKPQIIESRLKK